MASEWQELVKVNGSFYCNLSTEMSDQSAYNSLESAAGASCAAPVDNKTVLKIGQPDHTIKLVIGEPLSLDTSEYVSWNGSSGDPSPAASPAPPLPSVPPPAVSPVAQQPTSDPLTDTCCQFFDQRRRTLHQWIPAVVPGVRSASQPQTLSLQAKMAHLRREIVSLVNQDDVLFRQLLALSTSIRELRTQQQQQRDEEECEGIPVRMSLSPTPSTSSMNSLASSSDEEAQRPEPNPLTRKKISYPPSSRNRLHTSSAAGRNSASSSSPTWSLGSPSSEEETVRKTPRSPHSSFYTRVSLPQGKHPHRKPPADVLSTAHRRQGSYDSGIQGSEPSDAEVFV